MPPQTRLLPSWTASALRLVKSSLNTTDGAAELSLYQTAVYDFASVPRTLPNIRAAPAPMQVMLLECDGYGGVISSGTQVVSASVAELLSWSAFGIAISGRHRR